MNCIDSEIDYISIIIYNLTILDDKCDACKYGYYNLTDTNPLGCTPCDCNPMGATSQFCDPVTGQCPCEDRVVGRKCDVCTSGYYDFFNNCVPCKCDVQGTIPGSICNAVTGQCVCKTNVQGLACNECADGSYAFGASTDKGCNDCTCDLAGTINSTSSCDKVSGNCHCKENVEGMSCNQCKGNTFGLNITDPEGCQSCKCDPTGTQSGNTSADLACDQNTGQCACLAKRFGRTCDDCEQGRFFLFTRLCYWFSCLILEQSYLPWVIGGKGGKVCILLVAFPFITALS